MLPSNYERRFIRKHNDMFIITAKIANVDMSHKSEVQRLVLRHDLKECKRCEKPTYKLITIEQTTRKQRTTYLKQA